MGACCDKNQSADDYYEIETTQDHPVGKKPSILYNEKI